jgi:hypothetical protein
MVNLTEPTQTRPTRILGFRPCLELGRVVLQLALHSLRKEELDE